MTTSLHDRVVAAIGDHYELESEIGRGGMSVVYRARDLRLNRPVAIKVLPPELAHDPAVRTRFTREAQMSAHLAHAHIVPIYDVGERDGIAYLVMAFVAGGNLATLLAHEPRQPIDEVRRLLCEVADALAYAHLRGVIHRDIKPDNILLDRDSGRAMVTDFGIARAIEAGARVTVTGIAVGTPAYMSPEQAVGEKEIDGRSDIYSLGVLGYQMITGRVPFTASNSMALLMKHVTEAPRPIAELRPDTPKGLRDTIERALLKAPEDRWPSATTMRDAIRSEESFGASWRAGRGTEKKEPVRYTSPIPSVLKRERTKESGRAETPRSEARVISPRRGTPAAETRAGSLVVQGPRGPIVIEQEHLVGLTKSQRDDLRLWNGRVHVYDRIKAMRGYFYVTVAVTIGSMVGLAGIEDFPPVVLGPLVPFYMWLKTHRRMKSLREAGLRVRRVLFMPRAKWILPKAPAAPTEQQLGKLAPKEVIESPHGSAIRRAAEDRAAIFDIVASLSKEDRGYLPDLKPTANALVDRVAHLAQMLHRLDRSMDPELARDLDARIADAERDSGSSEAQRRLALFRRQRDTLNEIAQRRATLAHQLENAGLALMNLRLDLIKFRSSGLQSALADVTSATQEARALSREIGVVLDAAAEARSL